MISYIALLRGVNVGGNRKVSMAELRVAVRDDIGFAPMPARCSTAATSSFGGGRNLTPAAVEKKLEAETWPSSDRPAHATSTSARPLSGARSLTANPVSREVAVQRPSHYRRPGA